LTVTDREPGLERPVKKYGIVFNHDEDQYSVYEVESEKSALNAIETYKKDGKRVELAIHDAADMDAALRIAEAMNETHHYHRVANTLGSGTTLFQ
jgi:hypothetical protein